MSNGIDPHRILISGYAFDAPMDPDSGPKIGRVRAVGLINRSIAALGSLIVRPR